MMESGLFQFYTSIANYKRKLFDQKHMIEADNSFRAFTMAQFKKPIVLILNLLVAATIILITEISIFKIITFFYEFMV